VSGPTIYTIGYAQWSIEEVHRALRALRATLVDVRYRPHTSKPGFAKPDLEERLGRRYRHVAGFGNARYRAEGVELADPADGLDAVRPLDRPLVLMCGCRAPEQCHRTTVAELLHDEFGGTIQHLRAPSERAQPSLFDEGAPPPPDDPG
jgi:uncharacterized protein (DUF488 family)